MPIEPIAITKNVRVRIGFKRIQVVIKVCCKVRKKQACCKNCRRVKGRDKKQKTTAESDGFCGEGGIRTRGTELPVRQFSKLLISATHPPHRLKF